jgi:hypothetical protein
MAMHAQFPRSFSASNISFFIAEQKDTAVKLYKQGIAELEKGIEVNVWQGEGEKWTKAQKLNEKMVVNLSMAKDRLHFLGKLSDIHNVQID